MTMTNDGFGGGEFYARDYMRALSQAGHDVRAFIAGDRTLLRDELSRHGIKSDLSGVPVRMSRAMSLFKNGLALRRRVRAWRPDVVIDNLPRSIVLSGLFARGCPHIALLHGPLRTDPISQVARLFIKRLLMNTPETARKVLERVDSTTPWRVVLPTASVPTLREDVSHGRNLITMVGRWQSYKGHEDFIRAASIIAAKTPNLRFCIIGSVANAEQNAHRERMICLIEELGLRARFDVLIDASNEEIEVALQQTVIYAHLAKTEDFGISILEALLAGCGVVAYAAVGPQILLSDTDAARLVDVGDTAAFVNELLDLVNTADRQLLASRARDHGSQFAYSDRYVRSCDDAVRELLA